MREVRAEKGADEAIRRARAGFALFVFFRRRGARAAPRFRAGPAGERRECRSNGIQMTKSPVVRHEGTVHGQARGPRRRRGRADSISARGRARSARARAAASARARARARGGGGGGTRARAAARSGSRWVTRSLAASVARRPARGRRPAREAAAGPRAARAPHVGAQGARARTAARSGGGARRDGGGGGAARGAARAAVPGLGRSSGSAARLRRCRAPGAAGRPARMAPAASAAAAVAESEEPVAAAPAQPGRQPHVRRGCGWRGPARAVCHPGARRCDPTGVAAAGNLLDHRGGTHPGAAAGPGVGLLRPHRGRHDQDAQLGHGVPGLHQRSHLAHHRELLLRPRDRAVGAGRAHRADLRGGVRQVHPGPVVRPGGGRDGAGAGACPRHGARGRRAAAGDRLDQQGRGLHAEGKPQAHGRLPHHVAGARRRRAHRTSSSRPRHRTCW